MATNRLYSFRFPFDIASTLEPWREALNRDHLLTGSGGFDSVVARLADRDRALEDYVNLGMSQGRLGYATSQSAVDATAGGPEVNVPGLSVTVVVPANRVIRVTGHVFTYMEWDTSAVGRIYEDSTIVGFFAEGITQNWPVNATLTINQSGSVILTPTAGVHTYKLAAINTGTRVYRLGGSSATPSFILVEDIGPVNT